MKQKEKKENKASEKNSPPAKNNNKKVLLWILGGCLALLIITGLIAAGFLYWGYKKINQAASDNKRQIEERQNEMKKINELPQNISAPTETSVPEPPQAINEEPPTNNDNQSAEGMSPFSGEKQIGYVKKVYEKNGKRYLAIDYIQWLAGAAAEKAMREDGECSKTGECIVLNDYYIRNVNPLIRTFEIAADAEITMQTYDMETTGQIQAQKISFSQFSQIWSTNTKPNLKNVPYIVEISSNQIVKINEQYIP